MKSAVSFIILLSLIGCSPKELTPPEEARAVLLDSQSISFAGSDILMMGDGIMSIGHFYKTDSDVDLILFLDCRVGEDGYEVDVIDSSQEIQIGLEENFSITNLFSVARFSKEEDHLLSLIYHSTGEEYDPVYSKIRTNLIEIIKVRNIPWGRSRKRKTSNQRLEPTQKTQAEL